MCPSPLHAPSRADPSMQSDGGGLPTDFQDIEWARIKRQRHAVGLELETDERDVPGLAISGGGIRSAVFSLGVLQHLAGQQKLKHFGYLSTVSGGSYIGAFYGSLFVPNSMREGNADPPDSDFYLSARDAADQLNPDWAPDSPDAVSPLAYLRDNGNYLIPNGLDDLLQSIAFSFRNWFALQYVIGVSILTILLFVALLGMFAGTLLPLPPLNGEHFSSPPTLAEIREGASRLPVWAAAAVAALLLSPISRAYWLTKNFAQDRQWWYKVVPFGGSLVVIAIATATILVSQSKAWMPSASANSLSTNVTAGAKLIIATQLLAWIALARSLQVVWPQASSASKVDGWSNSRPFVDRLRNALTNAYTVPPSALRAVGFPGVIPLLYWLLGIALIEKLGTLWLNGKAFLSLSAITAAVWSASKFLLSNGTQVKGLIMGVRPIVLASICALVATLSTFAFWSTVAQQLILPFLYDNVRGGFGRFEFAVFATCVLLLILVAVDGLCIQFLNLSTYQRLYSTRLTRTFLGATNRTRLDHATKRDVTALVYGDSISMRQYYDERNHAPVHLINTTINKTVDWHSSLVHRGARGLVMSIGPAGITVGAKMGVLKCAWGEADDMSTPATHILGARRTDRIWLESMTLGDWIAISGAAVSTGLGQGTRFGYSILLGLANIRLGYWWDTVTTPQKQADIPTPPWYERVRVPLPSPPASAAEPGRSSNAATKAAKRNLLLSNLFTTQRCLFAELIGAFDGPRSRRWYLTDGGHFDNTGAYELLRRRLKFIVILDNGADPDLLFNDIANLIHLARVDFGIEITESLSLPATLPQQLKIKTDRIALSFGDFARNTDRLAVLLKTRFANAQEGLVLIVKPRVTNTAPYDACAYRNRMPSFPHEATANQFFDGTQWECHRALGESQAASLF